MLRAWLSGLLRVSFNFEFLWWIHLFWPLLRSWCNPRILPPTLQSFAPSHLFIYSQGWPLWPYPPLWYAPNQIPLPPHLKSNIHCWIPCPPAHLYAGFGFPPLLLTASSAFSWTHFCLHPFSHSRSHWNRLLPPSRHSSRFYFPPCFSPSQIYVVPAASKVHTPPHGLASTHGSCSHVLTLHWPWLWLRGPGPQKAEAEQVPSSPVTPPHRSFSLPVGPYEPEFPPSHLHCTPCSREISGCPVPKAGLQPRRLPITALSPELSVNFRKF